MSNITDFVIENGVLAKYNGQDCDVVIPEGVTGIGDFAFSECSSLISITIPDGVTDIGGFAFSGCSSLTAITIPDSVTSIGDYAFRGCENLTNITISNSVANIGSDAFSGCNNHVSNTLPSNVASIGLRAFDGCNKLINIYADEGNNVYSSLDGVLFSKDKTCLIHCPCAKKEQYTIPQEVITIGDRAFENCESLISIDIPDSVTSIGKEAFWRCKNLEKIIIPDSVTSIGDGAFEYCNSLADADGFIIVRNALYGYCGNKESIIIPDSVRVISREAFMYQYLTSITIPDSVTNIGERAFSALRGLEEIIIPGSVTSIGKEAFSYCKNLEKIIIPDSVTNIGTSAFYGCKLHYLYAPKISVDYLKDMSLMAAAARGFLSNHKGFTDETIIKEYEKYVFVNRKKLLSYIFKNDITDGVAFYADAGKITVKNFEEDYLLPAQKANAVQCVSYLMDWYNRNISQEEKDKQFEKELNKNPFSAVELKKLWSVEKLEDGTLTITGYKGSDTEISIPERIGKASVTKIADYAFSPGPDKYQKQVNVLKKLERVVIPDSVTSIGDSAFNGCESLKSIDIPDSVTSIGNFAFYGCSSLTSITMPDSVTSIGDWAFKYCNSLADADGFIVVCNVLYGYCGNKESIIIPDSVRVISRGAFENQYHLTSVTIPDSVTGISKDAFWGCKGLEKVIIINSAGAETSNECTALSIHAHTGSYAEQYAKENNITFVAE